MSTRHATLVAVSCVMSLAPMVCMAQVDYSNTDAGRPLRIDISYTIEHRGIEFQAAPMRIERSRSGTYAWAAEPRLEYGVFPRTQIDSGVPLLVADSRVGGRTTAGIAGIDVAVLHNLNMETAIPALAIGVDAFLPVGAFGPRRAFVSALGVITRSVPSLGAVRVHGNAQYTFGSRTNAGSVSTVAGPPALEVSRWLAGVAADRTFPLRSTLISAEVYARRPIDLGRAVEVSAATGVRRQLSPRWALDAGLGRRLSGDEQVWHATGGVAIALGLRPFRQPGH